MKWVWGLLAICFAVFCFPTISVNAETGTYGYDPEKAVSYAANLMNIETFVFGGGVAQSLHLLEKGIRAEAERSVLRTATKEIRIEYTALGYHAALIGAAAVALENM